MDAVHISLGRVSGLLAQAQRAGLAWLSPAELARCERIAAVGRREQFIAGRWLARQLLAAAHGDQHHRWQLSAPENGAPLVEEDPEDGVRASPPPCISLSHSGDHVACAVSPLPLGLDLEAPRRARDFSALADAIFSAGEAARWHAAEPAEQEVLFYEYWTLKEAWIKRRGEELSPGRLALIDTEPVASEAQADGRTWRGAGFTLALVCSAFAPLLRWIGEAPGECRCWRINDAGQPGASRS